MVHLTSEVLRLQRSRSCHQVQAHLRTTCRTEFWGTCVGNVDLNIFHGFQHSAQALVDPYLREKQQQRPKPQMSREELRVCLVLGFK